MSGIATVHWRREFFTPVLAPILRSRRMSLVLWAAGMAQIVLSTWLGIGWQCITHTLFGIPCPGCGLSRAITALLQGDWQAALALHAFAPLFLLLIGLLGGASLLPEAQRLSMVDGIDRIERQSGLMAWVLGGLIVYWLVRLAFHQI